jgi:hypothetical protein
MTLVSVFFVFIVLVMFTQMGQVIWTENQIDYFYLLHSVVLFKLMKFYNNTTF